MVEGAGDPANTLANIGRLGAMVLPTLRALSLNPPAAHAPARG
jgi:hypothetical protein